MNNLEEFVLNLGIKCEIKFCVEMNVLRKLYLKVISIDLEIITNLEEFAFK